MPGAEFVQVTVTIESREAALNLARSAVEARVAACAQVGGPIQSVYWWQDAVEDAQEWVLVLKATSAGYATLEQHIREHHSYDVPEIISTPILAGNPDYLAWVRAEAPPR